MDYLLYRNAFKVFRLKPFKIKFKGEKIDPLLQLPEAKCVMLLLQGYAPYEKREGKPQVSAYYVASNRLYQIAVRLVEELSKEHKAVLAKLPLKELIEQGYIGKRGVNDLCSTEGLGTYFSAQAILTDAFEPQDNYAADRGCLKCYRCVKACPTKAITKEGFEKEKCIRFHLSSPNVPDEIKEVMTSALGCDACQNVCPRNEKIKPYMMPEELDHIFSYRNIITRSKGLKEQYSMAVGSNRRAALRIHAFILAAKEGVSGYEDYARKLIGTREEDCARYYLDRLESDRKPREAPDEGNEKHPD